MREELLAQPLPPNRFGLYTQCGSIGGLIFYPNDIEDSLDVSLGDLEVSVINRLRAARIFDNYARPHISAYINIFGSFFSLRLSFQKDVIDEITGISRSAETWYSLVIGTHGQSGEYIMTLISREMDKFLTEYFEVNNDCGF